MAAAIRPGSGSLKSVSVVRATVQVYAPPVSARRASAFADGRCSSTGARTRDRLADCPYVRLHGCAVRGVGASAHGRSPFHPHSTASSPGSARKNFWRVVIVEVRPAGAPARTSCSAQGLPSPELDPAQLRRKSLLSNDAVASFEESSEKRELQFQIPLCALTRVSAVTHRRIARGHSHHTV